MKDREQIFLEILKHLWDRKGEFKEISEKAGVHISTLYNWTELKTFAPRIDTLCKVSGALGFEIVLELKRPKLKIAKVA